MIGKEHPHSIIPSDESPTDYTYSSEKKRTEKSGTMMVVLVGAVKKKKRSTHVDNKLLLGSLSNETAQAGSSKSHQNWPYTASRDRQTAG
jgi:hypothetical protein